MNNASHRTLAQETHQLVDGLLRQDALQQRQNVSNQLSQHLRPFLPRMTLKLTSSNPPPGDPVFGITRSSNVL